MEVLVDNLLDELMSDSNYIFPCKCESCIDNIRAITLNAVKPFYVTTKTGEVFGTYRNLEAQNRCDLMIEIVKAKELVGKNPKH
ncbi:MAG: late competence development ComFB family protein [Oscillospiraceae bacterium]